MANRFAIEVTATDKFSKVFDNLNKKAEQATKPLGKIQRFSGAGLRLEPMMRGMTKASEVSVNFGRSLGIATSGMESLFSLGGAAGLAGIVASAAAIASNFGRAGFEVNRTSGLLGVSARDLQVYRAAAQQAGTSADDFTASLSSIGSTVQNAVNGRNGDALALLVSRGIEIKRTKEGVIDTIAMYRALSDELTKIKDPLAQKVFAGIFGINDQTLAVMKRGSQALDELASSAKKAGTIISDEDIKKADAFTAALNRMTSAIDGVGKSTGSFLTPRFTAAMNAATTLISGGSVGIPHAPVTPNATGGQKHSLVLDALRLWLSGGNIGLFNKFGPQSSLAQRSSSGVVQDGNQPLGMRLNNPGSLRSWGGVPTVGGGAQFSSPGDLRAAVALTPAEQARSDAYEASPENLSVLRQALAAEKRPEAKAILLSELNKQTGFGARVQHEQGKQPGTAEQFAAAVAEGLKNMKIDVTVHGATGGTSATARMGNAYAPTPVSYAMPGGTLP